MAKKTHIVKQNGLQRGLNVFHLSSLPTHHTLGNIAQSEAQVKSCLAASKAEMEQIRREGEDRLEDSTSDLKQMVLVAERALQVNLDLLSCP